MISDAPVASSPTVSPGVGQFIKFCVVGASSTVLDVGTFNIALRLGYAPVVALAAGFAIGVSNGFYWNRRWTFKDRAGDVARQGPLFFVTNLVGLFLNVLVTTFALHIAARLHLTRAHLSLAETWHLVLFRQTHGLGFSLRALNAAKLCAVVVVTMWNFLASKFITFKA
jgi:putative flippase GtrA